VALSVSIFSFKITYLKSNWPLTFPGAMLGPTKNLGLIGSAVFTFIGYKQTDKHQNRHPDTQNLYINFIISLPNIHIYNYYVIFLPNIQTYNHYIISLPNIHINNYYIIILPNTQTYNHYIISLPNIQTAYHYIISLPNIHIYNY